MVCEVVVDAINADLGVIGSPEPARSVTVKNGPISTFNMDLTLVIQFAMIFSHFKSVLHKLSVH